MATRIDQASRDFQAEIEAIGSIDVDDIEDALNAGADLLLDDWVPRIPRDTGRLAESAKKETQRKSFRGGVLVAVGPGPAGWFFHFVELGTVHVSAQPSLRPAFDANRGRIADRIANRLGSRLSVFGVT